MRNFCAFALMVLSFGLSSCATPVVKPLGKEVGVMDLSETETGEETIDSSNTEKGGAELGIVEEDVPAKATPKKKKGGSVGSLTTKKK